MHDKSTTSLDCLILFTYNNSNMKFLGHPFSNSIFEMVIYILINKMNIMYNMLYIDPVYFLRVLHLDILQIHWIDHNGLSYIVDDKANKIHICNMNISCDCNLQIFQFLLCILDKIELRFDFLRSIFLNFFLILDHKEYYDAIYLHN